ncbi:hypothetical protein H9P43_004871 [Blastocladiella emersonii ATCC 22665]|nr:hypothetical protein H9P43_004871 [Blastocladiella emersonii ATCC 22665]
MQILALIAALALVLATASTSTEAAPAPAVRAPVSLKDRYIVTLKGETDLKAFSRALKAEVAAENAREAGNSGVISKIDHEFDTLGDFKGYAGTFAPGLIKRLQANGKVAAVEADATVYATATQTPAGSWGLTRVGQRDLNLAAGYTYPDSAGAGVTAYVIDTGVLVSHPELEGRATFGFKADASWSDGDGNGHGTHVAGTIASKKYGVAKAASIVAVKVLGDDGSGTNSGVIAGINWVAAQAKAAGKTAVANMSLGGGKSAAVNAAIKSLVNPGVVAVVAAGNESQDACNVSPASEPSAVTVASSTKTDALASSSNYGSGCVDIIAPGVAITSTWNNGATNTISGTSMASPHVAGAASLILGANPSFTVSQVVSQLLSKATPNKITGTKGTPNKLVFVN